MSASRRRAQRPVRFAGSPLPADCHHVCAFFDSTEESERVIHPFTKDGVERGERGFHIVDPDLRARYVERLEEAGVEVRALEAAGQFEIRTWDEAYLRNARFEPDAMLSLIREILDGGHDRGYPLTRLVAHMEWSLEDFPGTDRLIEYESRLNHVLPEYDDAVVCVYDTARFGAGTVLDVLRTHPMVVLHGVLRENPFYVPPDRFLRELKERSDPSSQA